MTAGEWRASDDPAPMLGHMRPAASPRRLRLFAAGCCQLALNSFAPPAARRAARLAAMAVDHQVPGDLLRRVQADAEAAARAAGSGYLAMVAAACAHALDPDPWAAAAEASEAAARAAADAGTPDGSLAHPWVGMGQEAYRAELAAHADLMRELFGDPSRPVAFDPRWRTETAVSLAAGIDASGAFDRMPILADALEDAGCDDADLLTHCRDSQPPHARGCWVVDLVLGKE
jgi:hypothetical protein